VTATPRVRAPCGILKQEFPLALQGPGRSGSARRCHSAETRGPGGRPRESRGRGRRPSARTARRWARVAAARRWARGRRLFSASRRCLASLCSGAPPPRPATHLRRTGLRVARGSGDTWPGTARSRAGHHGLRDARALHGLRAPPSTRVAGPRRRRPLCCDAGRRGDEVRGGADDVRAALGVPGGASPPAAARRRPWSTAASEGPSSRARPSGRVARPGFSRCRARYHRIRARLATVPAGDGAPEGRGGRSAPGDSARCRGATRSSSRTPGRTWSPAPAPSCSSGR
jgi:hypothetical protein